VPEQVILDSANDIFAWQSANGRAQIFGVGPPTRAIFFWTQVQSLGRVCSVVP